MGRYALLKEVQKYHSRTWQNVGFCAQPLYLPLNTPLARVNSVPSEQLRTKEDT